MARPIDANILLEKLQRMIDYCKNDNQVNGLTALFQVGDAIMDCPTLASPNEWVSVEDAMPPELKMVLVYCGGLYDVAGWVKNEDGEVCWTCKTAPDFWRQIPEME